MYKKCVVIKHIAKTRRDFCLFICLKFNRSKLVDEEHLKLCIIFVSYLERNARDAVKKMYGVLVENLRVTHKEREKYENVLKKIIYYHLIKIREMLLRISCHVSRIHRQ